MSLAFEFLKTLFKDQIPDYSKRTIKLWMQDRIGGNVLVALGLVIGISVTYWSSASHISNLNERYEMCQERVSDTKDRCEANLKINESMNKVLSYTIEHKDVPAVKLFYDQQGKKQLESVRGLDFGNLTETDKPNVHTPPTEQEVDEQNSKEDLEQKTSAGNEAPKSGLSAQQYLVSCLIRAANEYNVPAAVLIGMMHIEGGKSGEEQKQKNGASKLGLYMISSSYIPQLGELWDVRNEKALASVRDNSCVNVNVAAWILSQKIEETGSLYNGIQKFHSNSSQEGKAFADKVISKMDSLGLVKRGSPSVH